MKKNPTAIISIVIGLALFIATTTEAQVVFWQDNFDGTGPNLGGGDRDAPNHTDGDDGFFSAPGDYFFRTTNSGNSGIGLDTTFTGQSGSFWRGEDLNGTGGTNPDVINWTGINIAGITDIAFSGDFGAAIFEWDSVDSDSIIVDYSIDGSLFSNLLTFSPTQVVSGNLQHVGPGTMLNSALDTFSANISGTGNTLSLRLTASADENGEEFAFDNFELTGVVPEPSTYALIIGGLCLGFVVWKRRRQSKELVD